jgi:tape measure domain-containing protein
VAGKRRFTVEILGDEKGLSGAVGRSEKSLGRLNVVSRIGGRGLSLVSTGALAAAGGLVALGGAGFAAGLKTASGMEQAKISFTTMLGSAEKANAFLQDLQKFAASTPFEFPELQSAASSLISAGINANKVIPIMTTLGDVTSGMGTGSEGVQRATIALQQMSAAGKITGEDLNQLRDAGVPVFDLLAAATGKSKAQVVALAQAGKLGSKELGQLMNALETGKGLERFSGLMEKQSHSLAGLWSTFKDTVSMSLANLITPAMPAIKAGLGWLTGVTAAAAPKIQAVFAAAGIAVKALVAAFREGDVTSDGFVGVMERLGGVLRLGWLGVTALVAAFKDGDVTSDGFVGAMERLGVFVRRVADWFTGTALPALRQFGSFLTGTAVPALVAFGGWLIGIRGWLIPIGAGVLAIVVALRVYAGVMAVVRAATAAWAAVQAVLNVVLTANPIGLVVLALVGLAAAVMVAWQRSETFRNIVTGAFNAVKGAAGAVLGWLRQNWPLLLGILTGPVGLAVVAIVRNWDKISGGAKSVYTKVRGWLDRAVLFIAGMPGRIGRAASGMWNGIVSAFKGAINAVIGGWNGLQFSVPGFSAGPVHFGGFVLGVPDIPYLAEGGIVRARRGGTLAVLGEGGRDEAVVPLDRAGMPARVVLEIRSSGSAVDDFLVRLLRNAVRVRGGNVQTVLGRG